MADDPPKCASPTSVLAAGVTTLVGRTAATGEIRFVGTPALLAQKSSASGKEVASSDPLRKDLEALYAQITERMETISLLGEGWENLRWVRDELGKLLTKGAW